MKTYKLIIELSDSMLEKMTDIEEALKSKDSGIAIVQLMTMMALRRKLEENGSMTVNMDAVEDDKELVIIKQAVVGAGAVGIAQEARIKDKKEQEQKTLESNLGSQTSSLYNPNSSYFDPKSIENSNEGYKLEL